MYHSKKKIMSCIIINVQHSAFSFGNQKYHFMHPLSRISSMNKVAEAFTYIYIFT